MVISPEQTARNLFAHMPEVQAIYADDQNLWIFIGGDKYDDALMKRLIAQEEKLIDIYPALWVRIIPAVLCDDPREVTGTARTVYLARTFD